MQKITIKSNFDQVAFLSDWLRANLDNDRVGSRTLDQIELLAVEVVNNVIEHAYMGESGHEILVSLNISSDKVSITVCDYGRPAPTLSSYDDALLPDAETLPENGWGLALIGTLADRVDVDRRAGVNTILLEKSLPPCAGSDPASCVQAP